MRVQVIGAGLIGTSIALGLREVGWSVTLDDANPDHVRAAVDRGSGDAGRDVDADLVVVAVPPSAVPAVVADALETWPDAVITDVTSVKRDVISTLADHRQASRFVGSHPMAGSERSGPAAASARLFEGRPWVLVPTAASSVEAVDVVRSAAESLGAAVTEMDAETHDQAVALVSHVPQLLSVLTAARLADAPDSHVALAGQGLRDVTRIAGSDPELWTDILTRNADAVAQVLAAVRDDLEAVIDALQGESDALRSILATGRQGTTAIPGKHGADAVPLVPVYVVVADRPRELERVVIDAGQSGVNIEDLRIQHELGRPAGVVEIHVLPEHAEPLVQALIARGWPAYL